MAEMFSYTFMQNALILTVLASISCGVVGSLITVNRMSSFTGSIAHASFGGLGLAYLVGIHPMIGANLFAVGSALGIGALSDRSKLGSDTAMAALSKLHRLVILASLELRRWPCSDFRSALGEIRCLGLSGNNGLECPLRRAEQRRIPWLDLFRDDGLLTFMPSGNRCVRAKSPRLPWRRLP